ncbi:prepilin-type N-terminal cleavage/methylation domain-containing protein [Elusimicrobium posterum]|uniref:type IV pilin protein n=1 Tax=Elusimicrobium posterum TaxID=3116653 RepID=UPI003C778832
MNKKIFKSPCTTLNLLKSSGFTLIELLVVVLIIGILAAIALPQYQKAVFKSRLAEAVITLKNLEGATERHALQNGDWPVCNDWDALDLDFPTKSIGTNGDIVVNKTLRIRINCSNHLTGNHVQVLNNGANVMLLSQIKNPEGYNNKKYSCRYFYDYEKLAKPVCQAMCGTKNDADFTEVSGASAYCFADSIKI